MRLATNLVSVALIPIAVAIVYMAALDAGFMFDDVPNIVSNPAAQPESITDFGQTLQGRGKSGRHFVENRPVAMFSFGLNYLVHGFNTTGYHLVNIAIHAINAVLLFVLIRLLPAPALAAGSPDRHSRFAFWAALIWALHPVNTQAVTYIVQRMTSLAALGFFAAMLLFVLWRTERLSGRIAWPAIVVAFVLALGSKAHVVTLPAVLLLMDIVLYRRFGRVHKLLLALLGATAIALTYWYLGDRGFWTTAPGRDFSPYDRVLTQGRVLWHYLGIWFWPDPGRLQLDYNIVVSRGWFSPWYTTVAWTGMAVAAGCALYFMRRYPWPAFAVLFFLVTSSVEASFITLELVFEHRMYLPGAFLAAGALSFLAARLDHRFATPVLLALILALGLATTERNRHWADIGNFWAEELERGAKPARAAINAALRYNRMGNPEAALAVIDRAPSAAELTHLQSAQLSRHRADALFALGRYEEAETAYREVVQRYPNDPVSYYMLGQIWLETGRIEQAEQLADWMLEFNPRSAYASVIAALVSDHRGETQIAVDRLESFLEQTRVSVGEQLLVRAHLGDLYRTLGRYDDARQQYRLLVDLEPTHWVAWAQILFLLEAGGDEERAAAIRRYLDERGVNPDHWRPQ